MRYKPYGNILYEKEDRAGIMRRIGIIGGGAAGMAAAITAARNDRQAKVWILEQKEKIGKKILATGNGRCNLTNCQIDGSCAENGYRGEDLPFVKKVLERFGYKETMEFFESLGLVAKRRGDYVYPRSDQASSVLELLELELRRLGVEVYCGGKVTAVAPESRGFNITVSENQKKRELKADRVILACGGRAASTFGSDGSGYDLAKSLGHHMTPVVPALVQLKVKNHPFAKASGVRAKARVTALVDGAKVAADAGELQITAYGISGIPVFQISRFLAYGLYQKKRAEVSLDLLPEYTEEEAGELFVKLAGQRDRRTIGECLTGVFHRKLIPRILELSGTEIHEKVGALDKRSLFALAGKCKKIILTISDTNGFENAQVCAGGVRTKEVCPATMESRCVRGLYLAGELLDADGICGGYNLQWAWATGCIAGKAAADAAAF